MSAWMLMPQEVEPVDGAFANISELVFTTAALAQIGEESILLALATLARTGIVRRLDVFQVLKRDDGEKIYAVDEDGRVTLMLPGDW